MLPSRRSETKVRLSLKPVHLVLAKLTILSEVSQGEIAARNLVDQGKWRAPCFCQNLAQHDHADEDDSDDDDLRGRDGINTGLARRRHGSHGQL